MTTALFPGKFQPPHIGHIMLAAYCLQKYDSVIICITTDTPQFVPHDEVERIFKIVFYDKEFTFVSIDGTLIDRKDISILPTFDVVVSGNPQVHEWAEGLGIKYEEAPYWDVPGASGTIMRKIYGIDSLWSE